MIYSIFRDRDGKLSIARIGMFWTILIATAFFTKAFFSWQSLPDGIIPGLGAVAASLTAWNASTKFSKSDKVEK